MRPPRRCFGASWTSIIVACLFAVTDSASAQTVLYVDESAGGSIHDGSSWCNAYLSLHSALTAAPVGTTIRAAGGVYRPDPTGLPDPRKATFTLKNGVTVEGGYAGCGALDPNLRDVTLHATILSGDVANNDPSNNAFRDCCHATYESGCPDAACQATVCAAHSFCCEFGWEEICVTDAQALCGGLCQTGADNSYHVVTASGTDATAVLDGVIVTEGKADVPVYGSIDASGGGLYADAGSPTLRVVRFIANDSFEFGGGAFLKNGTVHAEGCEFTENRSRSYDTEGASSGGGAYVAGGDPILGGCTFTENQGDGFGSAGIYFANSNAQMSSCHFQGNWGPAIESVNGTLQINRCRITANGGGILLTGGIIEVQESIILGNYGVGIATQGGTQSIDNTLIARNFGGASGGGLSLFAGTTTIRNASIISNFASHNGGGLYAIGNTSAILSNTIVWGNQSALGGQQLHTRKLSSGSTPTTTVSFCNVQGGQGQVGGDGNLTWGPGIIDSDPLFLDPDGSDDIPGNFDDDFHLHSASPCVDTGDNASVPGGALSDLDGNPRIIDANADGASIVDMGTYEFQRPVPALGTGASILLFLSFLIGGAVLIRCKTNFLLRQRYEVSLLLALRLLLS